MKQIELKFRKYKKELNPLTPDLQNCVSNPDEKENIFSPFCSI